MLFMLAGMAVAGHSSASNGNTTSLRNRSPGRSDYPHLSGFYPTCIETAVASQVLWTPRLIVTSPYDGNASGSSTVTSYGSFSFKFAGSSVTSTTTTSTTDTISVTNGEVAGLFEADQWTIYQLTNGTSSYPPGTGYCTASYTAQITQHESGIITHTLLGGGSVETYPVETSFGPVYDSSTGQSYYSVHLPDLNYTTTDNSIADCGSVGLTMQVAASNYITGTIGIAFSGDGVSGSLAMTQGSGNSVVYTYNFPGNTGTWDYQYDSGQSNKSMLSFAFISCSGGGGGGCVLYGTLIRLANGTTIPVQRLRPGTKILSYNVQSQSLIVTTVSRVNETNTSTILNINHGLLLISGLNDQPVYAKLQNGTEEWLMVGMLNTTMKLFDPLNSTWINITSLSLQHGSYPVFDVQAAQVFSNGRIVRSDYIANGILVDKKAP